MTHSSHSNLQIPPNANEMGTYQFDLQELLAMRGADQTHLPKKLVGDIRCLKQILINLIKNALKFTCEGSIEIKTEYREDLSLLVVHVIDTGAGIIREDFPKIFTRFGKLHRTA